MYEGLSSKQVQERFEKHLNNEKVKKLTKSNEQIIRQNVFTYFNFINLILFILVLLTVKIKNGVFLGTVIFNACIGIYQQLKSKKLLDRLSFLAEDTVKVKRDGKWISISLEEIVVDDLIEIVKAPDKEDPPVRHVSWLYKKHRNNFKNGIFKKKISFES